MESSKSASLQLNVRGWFYSVLLRILLIVFLLKEIDMLLMDALFAWKYESILEAGLTILGTFSSTQSNIRYSKRLQQKILPFSWQHMSSFT